MMQHKLREEERELMRSSCEEEQRELSHSPAYLWFECTLSYHFSLAVKDEDLDIDVPDDEGSGSDMEECHPFKSRPRSSFMTGLQLKLYTLLTIISSLPIIFRRIALPFTVHTVQCDIFRSYNVCVCVCVCMHV